MGGNEYRNTDMLRRACATVSFALFLASPAMAQSPLPESDAPVVTQDTQEDLSPSPFERVMRRRQLGYGRLFTNDVIGDGQDRWRTGSLTISRAFGFDWDGYAPERPFQLLETRVQGQIIAPDNLTRSGADDRRYAGALSLGLHSHSYHQGLELALGADMVFIGPQTHLDELHKSIHDILGKPKPSEQVLANQIGNTIRPTAVAEAGRSYALGEAAMLRPFAEARVGDEDMVRVGADFTFGGVTQGELLSRESITGQRYRVIYASDPGTSFTIGGDIAYVADSVYLPGGGGVTLENQRERLRAGFHWQGRSGSVFYGLSYLGREFDTQPEGQVVGSLRIKLRF